MVGDVRSRLIEEAEPRVYVPQAQMAVPWITMLVRSQGEVAPITGIEQAVAGLDPRLPLRRIEPIAVWVDRARGPALFYLTLIAVFAAVALLLAAIGLYGVIAYLVAGQRRELAIRIAVGADRGRIVRLVLGQGAPSESNGSCRGVGAGVAVRLGQSSAGQKCRLQELEQQKGRIRGAPCEVTAGTERLREGRSDGLVVGRSVRIGMRAAILVHVLL